MENSQQVPVGEIFTAADTLRVQTTACMGNTICLNSGREFLTN